MRISLKTDYAIRAMAEIAAAGDEAPTSADSIHRAQAIPTKFLLNILSELRRAGLVESHRGAAGGYTLGHPAAAINLADIIRAVEGPLANVHEVRPENVNYTGASRSLREVWIAVRVNLRAVLEVVSLADLVAGRLPEAVGSLSDNPDAFVSH